MLLNDMECKDNYAAIVRLFAPQRFEQVGLKNRYLPLTGSPPAATSIDTKY
jgi:hypothetical protein